MIDKMIDYFKENISGELVILTEECCEKNLDGIISID